MTYSKSIKNKFSSGLLFIASLLFTLFANAQPTGTTCIDSNPFCTGSTYNFPNNPNNPGPNNSPSGPNYGCLYSQPKPIWYHMQIDTGGDLKITMKQTTGPNGSGSTLDLDFAMWGPFSDLATGCQQVMNGQAPLQCSYSASATENIGLGTSGGYSGGQSTPPPAQAGEYYIILLTNYSQSSGYIDFNQTGGAATTNCNIVTPCPLTSTISYPAQLCNTDTNIPVVQTGDLGGTFTSTPPGLSLNPTTGAINPSTSTVGGPYTVTYELIEDVDCFVTSSAVLNVISGGAPTFDQVAPICAGETFTLPVISTNGITGAWSPAIDLTTTTTYTFTPDPNQCGATPVNMTVVVNPIPNVSAGQDSTVCENSTFVFLGSGADSYVWDNGVTNGVPFTTSGVAPITYTVIGTTVAGCTNTDQMTLSITPLPIVSFTPDKVTGCLPLEVNFLDDNLTTDTYLWTFGNGQTSTTGPLGTTTYNAPGCFDVTLKKTTPNGCTNEITYASLVCLNPQPISEFIANPKVLSALESYSQMTNISSGATMYEWNFGDGSPINTQFAPGHEFPTTVAGSYEISLVAISEEGCRDTSKVIIEVLDELVYYVPNSFTPDGDEFNPTFKPIFTSGFEPLSYRLSVYNRWGELVFESLDHNFGWDGTYSGSEGHVQVGSYTWKIEFKTTLSDARKVIMGHVTLLR